MSSGNFWETSLKNAISIVWCYNINEGERKKTLSKGGLPMEVTPQSKDIAIIATTFRLNNTSGKS
jgi:hypothetical protein